MSGLSIPTFSMPETFTLIAASLVGRANIEYPQQDSNLCAPGFNRLLFLLSYEGELPRQANAWAGNAVRAALVRKR